MKKNKRCFSYHPLRWISAKLLVSLIVLFSGVGLYGQGSYVIRGKVVDSDQHPLPGVTIMVVDKQGVGVTTDLDGNYQISLDAADTALEFSFIGMETQRINLRGRTQINVEMKEDNLIFDEVIIVGYGQQKRASIVGAITQTTGKVLERAGGVSSIGSALTGNLPGVVTTTSTGMPGAEDPKIQIRAASTWNESGPLILVDGVERELSSVDINSVESISVLKDASATAVFGVQGANGVILITTKRGVEGKAVVSAGFNSTMKTVSKLPNKYDAYDALMIRNEVIEYELAASEDSWQSIRPYDIIRKYRYPADDAERDRYPNVDWQDALFDSYAMSYNANVNISGGTKSVKYYANVDYVNEGDLFKEYNSGRAYKPGFAYDRVNMRSNFDFQLTPSTLFKVNLAGSYGKRKGPWGNLDNESGVWSNAYNGAPDLFQPQYSNGLFGFYAPQQTIMTNSVRNLAVSGVEYQTNTTLTTDFVLEQDLGMFIKGLSIRGAVAIDNRFREGGRGVDDRFTEPNLMWVSPDTGEEFYQFTRTVWEGFDYPNRIQWTTPGGGVQNWSSFRRSDYSARLNYVTNIANRHDITGMGVFERKEEATGSEELRVRENWVFRATYAFDNKYSIEYNGAYNGSESYGSDYRFAFFSSGGVSWMISEENFMKPLRFLDMLRFRASYGTIGDDSGGGRNRHLYMDQWGAEGTSAFSPTGWDSGWGNRYEDGGGIGKWYKITSLGNPDLQWETVTKSNFGLEFGVFGGLIRGSFDYFEDVRDKILVLGKDRAVPSYFGAKPPAANTGKASAKGYEAELKLNHTFYNGLRLWADLGITHAENKVLIADEAQLLPDYMKSAGKMVNQTRSHLGNGYYNSWDELYASTQFESNDDQKLPGNYYIMDFNGDGVIDSYDRVPYSYPTVPQNTYTSTVGLEWRGFSTFVQFYGVTNVTRPVYYNSFANKLNSVFDEGSMWSKENTNPDVPLPAWQRSPNGAASGQKSQYDASYLRIKNAEIGYTFERSSGLMQKTGLGALRIYLNGNNLWMWTKMPDDRESNFATTNPGAGAYPSVKRFNLGLNVTF